MTVNGYITQKFQTFGIQLSEADLLDISLNSGISGEGEMNQDNIRQVSVAIAKFIPSLKLRATSISEGGVSISWNDNGIEGYYSFLCNKYNLPNELGSRIKILDISDYL